MNNCIINPKSKINVEFVVTYLVVEKCAHAIYIYIYDY